MSIETTMEMIHKLLHPLLDIFAARFCLHSLRRIPLQHKSFLEHWFFSLTTSTTNPQEKGERYANSFLHAIEILTV